MTHTAISDTPMSKQDTRPVSLAFLLSPRRTGSTLLYNILCQSPHVHPFVRDAELLFRLLEVFRWGDATYSEKVHHYFATEDTYWDFQREVAQGFIGRARDALGDPPTLVIKSPELSKHTPRLRRLFPQAGFVVAVRDPRDQIASEMDVAHRQVASGMRPSLPGIGELCSVFDTYWSGIDQGMALHPESFLLIRYEDLVTAPLRVTPKLQTFLGIDLTEYDPGKPWKRIAVDWEKKKTLPSWSDHYGQPVTATQVGRFKRVLSEEQISEVEAHLGHWMDLLHYPRHSIA
jgi:hypothetical protein